MCSDSAFGRNFGMDHHIAGPDRSLRLDCSFVIGCCSSPEPDRTEAGRTAAVVRTVPDHTAGIDRTVVIGRIAVPDRTVVIGFELIGIHSKDKKRLRQKLDFCIWDNNS